MVHGKGLFGSVFGKKDRHEEKEHRGASAASGNLADEEIHVLTGGDWQKLLEEGVSEKLSLLYSSGSEEEGSYEYTFRSEKALGEDVKKKLQEASGKQPGAVRLIFLSDQTFKILYIPA